MGWFKPAPHMCMQGAYIQLVDENSAWDEQAWRALFDNFRHLQIDRLVVQWTTYDRMAFYPSQRFETVRTPPLQTILDLADHAGMQVMIGLSHDSAYWTSIETKDKRSYLMERLRKNMAVADELLPLVSRHESFAGWYISEEIDDVNWKQADDRDALFSYLRQLSAFLRAMRSEAAIGTSGFANSQTPPSEVETFWTALLKRASAIDTVYFQDGIGVGKLDLDHLGRYYRSVKNATQATGRTFVPVVEAFTQISGPPISDGEFAAAPANLPRLLRQIDIAGQYAARRVAFGIPEYLTPRGGETAEKLYNDYLASMRTAKVKCRLE